MKKFFGLLTILAVCAAQASPVEPGDSREKVLEHLGEPQGLVKMNEAEWMLYPRGKVWLQGGVVTKAEIMSLEVFAAKQVRDELARIAEQIRLEAQRLERIEKGTELRSRLLESPDMYLKSSQEQLSIWQRFRRDYPEVDVSEQYMIVAEAARTERKQEDQEQRIQELEARVRAAEFRALEAQQAAVERSSFSRTRYTYPYPVVYSSSYKRVCPKYERVSHGHGNRPSHSYRKPHHPSSGVKVGGSIAHHRGHVSMKPLKVGHVKLSF